jgi:hypothetical protein
MAECGLFMESTVPKRFEVVLRSAHLPRLMRREGSLCEWQMFVSVNNVYTVIPSHIYTKLRAFIFIFNFHHERSNASPFCDIVKRFDIFYILVCFLFICQQPRRAAPPSECWLRYDGNEAPKVKTGLGHFVATSRKGTILT